MDTQGKSNIFLCILSLALYFFHRKISFFTYPIRSFSPSKSCSNSTIFMKTSSLHILPYWYRFQKNISQAPLSLECKHKNQIPQSDITHEWQWLWRGSRQGVGPCRADGTEATALASSFYVALGVVSGKLNNGSASRLFYWFCETTYYPFRNPYLFKIAQLFPAARKEPWPIHSYLSKDFVPHSDLMPPNFGQQKLISYSSRL
jgi:hypothetical protein